MGDLYETHKLGVLRFYLFTKSMTNGDEVFPETEEGADIQTDEQQESATGHRQQKRTMEDVEQLTRKTQDREQQIHTVEDDEQRTTKMSGSVSTAAVQVDLM